MQIALSEELKRFVDEKLQSGDYSTMDEVVADAISRWKANEEIDPNLLRRKVDQGRIEADRGQLLDSNEVFREIRQHSADRRSHGK